MGLAAGVVIEMVGGFLSTLKGPTGPAVVQFPTSSQTAWVPVAAPAVSVDAGTLVDRLNDQGDWAVGEAAAMPAWLSVALQGTETSVADHADEPGGVQVTTGPSLSTLTVRVVVEEMFPAASVAETETAVVPATVSGIDLEEPATVAAPVWAPVRV